MKRIALSLLAALLCVAAQAIKVNPIPTVVKQSDGSSLTIVGHGDCNQHWYTTIDGVLLFHEGFDYFVATVADDGSLMPTSQLAHEKSRRDKAEQALIMSQDKERFTQRMERQTAVGMHREPVADEHTYFPHTGSPKAVVILVQFQDTVFIDEDPQPVFEQYLNAEGALDRNVGNGTVYRNYGSVRRYFTEMSGGQFTPEFDIYGPVTLSHELKYYGQGRDYLSRLVPEACQLANEAGLDFSQYDANEDNYVDLVYIIYAGYPESITGNSSDCIWPCSGTIGGGTYNGKHVYRYGVHAERNGYPGAWAKPRIGGIGLFCHEFSHCMGLPDIYPTTTAAQNALNPSMEYWDLMDGGEYVQNGYYPTEYSAWEREAFGWMTIDTLVNSGTYQMAPLGAESGKAYRIMNDDDTSGKEYLLLHNIQPTGFNRIIGGIGHGMLVSHIEYDKSAFSLESNSVNNVIGHPRYTFIPADDEYISSYSINANDEAERKKQQQEYLQSHAGDPFPGSSAKTSLTPITFYTGTSVKQIVDITEDTETGIITFTYNDPNHPSAITLNEAERAHEGVFFSLDGTRMGSRAASLPKGIYVRNGKKVIVK